MDYQKYFRKEDPLAISSFNLLGMQANINVINKTLVKSSIEFLKKHPTSEVRFFEIRADLLFKNITPEAAILKYKNLLKKLDQKENFSWSGVKDHGRIDSYFDPFGNLNLSQRINLEIAREQFLIGSENYKDQKTDLLNQFKGLKRAMLEEYWKIYIENN